VNSVCQRSQLPILAMLLQGDGLHVNKGMRVSAQHMRGICSYAAQRGHVGAGFEGLVKRSEVMGNIAQCVLWQQCES
jgi:hypothetical protein